MPPDSSIEPGPAATPAALGYRMPAEWEPHAATWLSWPHTPETWPGQFEPIPAIWTELVAALSLVEPVHVLAGEGAVFEQANSLLAGFLNRSGAAGSPRHPVHLHPIATNDAWTRDHGPIFLVGPAGSPPVLVDWDYNAWGGKYPPYDLDQQVPRLVAEMLGYRRYEPGIVLEGGAIDVNGRGALLTTEQCLLNPNRNPHLGRRQVERYLADYLAARHVIWLGRGIAGDDTDGHIDELARFVGPRTVVAAVEEDPADENYRPLRDNFERLQMATDEQGRSLELVSMPMPRPVYYGDRRLPASYMNFYIANGLVIAPAFGDPADTTVQEALARLLPGRRVIGMRAVELAWGLGAFHCITQQQPVVPN
ncbi:MAG: agmatine deiminase family protein [Pirellulales bacterium]